MRGQFGLRPPARQNGRLLHRILHRLGEVVFGHLYRAKPAARIWRVERPAWRELIRLLTSRSR